ncbi:MAG: VWA domain-containing protein [Candidatus Heimdallarchaeota archaeon]|nr:VWA domain-containing protein [Candidatus Heimdallarchaeota archaeon]
MKRYSIYLSILLIISVMIGSVLSYATVISQEPSLPDEVLDEIRINFENKILLQAQEMWSEFAQFQSVIKVATDFTHKIWETPNQYTDVEFYYHNAAEVGMSTPPGYTSSAKYGSTLISKFASAYKIAPTAFIESYQEQYVNAETETINPLNMIDQNIYDLINQSSKLDHIFKELYDTNEDSTIWLYMGFEEGVHRSYPFHKISRTYDPRVRPWYVSAVTGAKDVIIVMDKSGSMEGEVIGEVKEAVKLVVDSLGNNDRFNVLTFSDEVEQFLPSLEVKSSEIEAELDDFLAKTRAGGTTNINEALVRSTSLLGEYGAEDHTPVILFLTDGRPSTGVTNTELILENVRRSNYADSHIITFGIGNEVDYELMTAIAEENDGKVIKINSTDEISTAMQLYGSFLSQVSKREIVSWGFPIIDASGQGLTITASSPVYIDDELLGVIAVDLHLVNLIDTLNTFKEEGEYSYIINVGGITVIHDEFADLDPTTWEENNVRKPIEAYETDDEAFIRVKEKAKGGKVGSAIIDYENETRVIAMVPIGNTSMIYGLGAKINDIINPTILDKINTLFVDQLSIIPGIAFGFITAVVIFIYISRIGPKKIRDKIEETINEVTVSDEKGDKPEEKTDNSKEDDKNE